MKAYYQNSKGFRTIVEIIKKGELTSVCRTSDGEVSKFENEFLVLIDPKERERVFTLIQDERVYQDISHRGVAEKYMDKDLGVGTWLLYIENLIQKAKDEVYEMNNVEALALIKKAVTVGVACLEHNIDNVKGRGYVE